MLIEPKMSSGGRHAAEISNESDVTSRFEFEFEFECNVSNVNTSVFRTVGYGFYVVTTDMLPVPCP